jgi:hypothetical protein
LAARLLLDAISAEPDYPEEANARVSDNRFARSVRLILDRGECGVLVGTVQALPDNLELKP